MKTFKQHIKESPDTVDSVPTGGGERITATFSDKDAIAFGILENMLFYSEGVDYHSDIGSKIMSKYKVNGFESLFGPTMLDQDWDKKNNYEIKTVILGSPRESEILSSGDSFLGRMQFDCAGRLWWDEEIISFWNKFSDVEPYFPLIIRFLEERGLNPSEMMYEFIDGKNILKWSELGRDELQNQRSTDEIEKDKAEEHMASPLQKGTRTAQHDRPTRRGQLVPKAGVQLSPGGRPVLGDSVETFKQYLAEVPLPPDWDSDTFTPNNSFAKKLRYAQERAAKMGTGSSRVAFNIDYEGRETVLKIAKNKKGLAQNAKEADYGLYNMYPDITIPLIDYDEDNEYPVWVHMEKADKLRKPQFKSIIGYSFNDFSNMLMADEQRRSGRNKMMNYVGNISDEEQEKIRESEFFYGVSDLLGNFDIMAGDLGRLANWGMYKGKPVIIDLGLDREVIRDFYS